MGMKMREKVESALRIPARTSPERSERIHREAVWERIKVLEFSQNEVARRAEVGSYHLSQLMNGSRSPSPGVLKRLHGVFY